MLAPDPDETAPIIVDALTLARQGAVHAYQFRHRRFERLHGLVVSDQPVTDVTLQFDLKRARPAINGTLQGTVELVCQRCMKAMKHTLNEEFELVIVDRDIELIDDRAEDLDETLMQSGPDEWIADATHLDVVALVEEQILLALPLVAKHVDESQCVQITDALMSQAKPGKAGKSSDDVKADANEELVRRPFANLRELLNK